MCGRPFVDGQEYLVWAYPPLEMQQYPQLDGVLMADHGPCGLSRDGPITEADEDVRFLSQMLPGASVSSPPLILFGVLAVVGVLAGLRFFRRQRATLGSW
jgi:hypothetical protein